MSEFCRNRILAEGFLRRSLVVTHANRQIFPLGQGTRDEIVTTNRLILILRGTLRYTVEGRPLFLREGTQFFVPAWMRRVCSASRGGACEIIWCEFDAEGGLENSPGFTQRILDASTWRRETRAFADFLRQFRSSQSEWSPLHLEAKLKILLVRFLEAAKPGDFTEMPHVHPRVKDTLRWLQTHFSRRTALEEAFARSGLTPNYFRSLFSQATLCSPHEYIERLRLRHARYLLRSTDWQLKRIAAEIGYDDPLYFSRLYRRFWKQAPSKEHFESPGAKPKKAQVNESKG